MQREINVVNRALFKQLYSCPRQWLPHESTSVQTPHRHPHSIPTVIPIPSLPINPILDSRRSTLRSPLIATHKSLPLLLHRALIERRRWPISLPRLRLVLRVRGLAVWNGAVIACATPSALKGLVTARRAGGAAANGARHGDEIT